MPDNSTARHDPSNDNCPRNADERNESCACAPPWSGSRPLILGGGRPTPGVNIDRIDVAAGMRELAAFYPDATPETVMVIEHALMRWARGEEASAERGAIDQTFHGIDFGSWRRVLAAARAAGEAKA